jgi:hypothetical protein
MKSTEADQQMDCCLRSTLEVLDKLLLIFSHQKAVKIDVDGRKIVIWIVTLTPFFEKKESTNIFFT